MKTSSLFTLVIALVAFSTPIAASSKFANASNKRQKTEEQRMKNLRKFNDEQEKHIKLRQKEEARQAKMTPQQRLTDAQRRREDSQRMAPIRAKQLERGNQQAASNARLKKSVTNLKNMVTK